MKFRAIFIISILLILLPSCGHNRPKTEAACDIEETNRVVYPGRSIDYKVKFRDSQKKHIEAAEQIGLKSQPQTREEVTHMRGKLTEVKDCNNYIVDELTHSVPYLVPAAKKELDIIGTGFADILQRNNLPHYQFVVTSILRTAEDVKSLQRSGNINSVSNSAHCYATTFDIAYARFNKVTRTHDYVPEDNLKLVLAQVLLNEQRAGNIYVKYEWKQCCFHITCRK